jgi:dTDP-4-dehydrorhamnose reductase
MAKIMLLGAGGQIGQAFAAQNLPEKWTLLPFDHAHLDLADRMAVRHAFLESEPDLVINAAAITNIETAEMNEEDAMRVNFEAPANLAALCSVSDVPMIHLSTDYVFDGERQTPYPEDEPVNPLNLYAKSKFLGEEAVRQELAWHVVLRVSSVFSSYGNNLLTKALGWFDTKDQVNVVTDQTIAPTYAPDAAEAILRIAADLMNGKSDGFGLFQYCGAPAVTRFEFVRQIWEAYRPHASKEVQLKPVTTNFFPDYAPRPAYSVMDCAKLEKTYGIAQKDWREGLAPAISKLIQKR